MAGLSLHKLQEHGMPRRAVTWSILAFFVLLGNVANCSPAPVGPPTAENNQAMPSRDRANQLAMSVQRLRNLPLTQLAVGDQIAFGTLIFRYQSNGDQLIVAIMVEDFDLWNKLGAERAAKYRKSQTALSDPAIGGLFDSGGGTWLFEEATGKTYLYAAFPLDAPPTAVNAQVERMARVVPAWTMRWTAEVARIAHGKRPPPSRPVTLEDDPYAGKL